MRRFRLVAGLLLASRSALAGTPVPEGHSCMPYGKDWAFMVSAPSGWQGECNAMDSIGAEVAYWPVGEEWGKGRSQLYVSVYRKDGLSVSDVIERDHADFAKRNPDGHVADAASIKSALGTELPVKLTFGLADGRFEAISYADQSTIVLIFGLSSRTAADRDAAMPKFRELIGSYLKIDKVDLKKARDGPT